MAKNGADPRFLELAIALSEAKDAESKASAARIQVEEQIIKHLGFKKEEGSESFDTSTDRGKCKLTLKQPVNRKVSGEEHLPSIKKALGKKRFDSVFRQKFEVVKKGFDALKAEDRDLFLLACRAITSTPGKVGVEIKNIERVE